MLASRLVLAPTKLRYAGRQSIATASKRLQSTTPTEVEAPSAKQLWRVFCHAAVPMIGFGFTDQTVMIQAGNAIDCTLGVIFGLSTLTAAAFGQICSDASGVILGGTLAKVAKAAGLPSANLSAAQSKLPIVGRVTLAGGFIGVITGCALGLVNLLFIDTSRSSSLKMNALNEGQNFEFTVEASNAARPDATSITVEGPNVDGVLASMTTSLAKKGCSMLEMSAKRLESDDRGNENAIRYVFELVNQETGEPFDDDDLEALATALLESSRTPVSSASATHAAHAAAVQELESPELSFHEKVQRLERRMTIVRSASEVPPAPTLKRSITIVRHHEKES